MIKTLYSHNYTENCPFVVLNTNYLENYTDCYLYSSITSDFVLKSFPASGGSSVDIVSYSSGPSAYAISIIPGINFYTSSINKNLFGIAVKCNDTNKNHITMFDISFIGNAVEMIYDVCNNFKNFLSLSSNSNFKTGGGTTKVQAFYSLATSNKGARATVSLRKNNVLVESFGYGTVGNVMYYTGSAYPIDVVSDIFSISLSSSNYMYTVTACCHILIYHEGFTATTSFAYSNSYNLSTPPLYPVNINNMFFPIRFSELDNYTIQYAAHYAYSTSKTGYMGYTYNIRNDHSTIGNNYPTLPSNISNDKRISSQFSLTSQVSTPEPLYYCLQCSIPEFCHNISPGFIINYYESENIQECRRIFIF